MVRAGMTVDLVSSHVTVVTSGSVTVIIVMTRMPGVGLGRFPESISQARPQSRRSSPAAPAGPGLACPIKPGLSSGFPSSLDRRSPAESHRDTDPRRNEKILGRLKDGLFCFKFSLIGDKVQVTTHSPTLKTNNNRYNISNLTNSTLGIRFKYQKERVPGLWPNMWACCFCRRAVSPRQNG
jgi:hypothetical protein